MLSWRDRPLRVTPLLFFDLETTGLWPDRGARITEIAVVDHRGVPFCWQRGHEASGADALPVALRRLFACLQTGVVVGHNVRFDFRFVAYEAERFGFDGPRVRFIDTLALARRLLPDQDDYRLGTLLARCGLLPDDPLHTAVTDAHATRTLFWHLVDRAALRTLADAGMHRYRPLLPDDFVLSGSVCFTWGIVHGGQRIKASLQSRR